MTSPRKKQVDSIRKPGGAVSLKGVFPKNPPQASLEEEKVLRVSQAFSKEHAGAAGVLPEPPFPHGAKEGFLLEKKQKEKEEKSDILPESPPAKEDQLEALYNSRFARENGESAGSRPGDTRFQPPAPFPLPHPQPPRRRIVRHGIILGLVFLAVLFFLASTRFARLTVFVDPREEQVLVEGIQAVFDARAARLDAGERTIPAQSFTFSERITQTFPATGKARVSEKSRGTVRIYNAFSSAPQEFIARTRFTTESGALFRLPKGLTVPGAKVEAGTIVPQFIETEFAADRPGETGNIAGEVRLLIPGFRGTPRYDGFYAVASKGFSGGAEGERNAVSKEDLAAAEETITKALYEKLEGSLREQIPGSLFLAGGLKEIEIKKVEKPNTGAVQDNFSVSAEAEARALAFRKEDVAALIGEVLVDSESGRAPVPGSEDISYRIQDADFAKGRARVLIQGSFKTVRTFSEESLAAALAARKEGSVIEVLKNREEFSKFRLSFFPPWKFSAPNDPKKIRFVAE